MNLLTKIRSFFKRKVNPSAQFDMAVYEQAIARLEAQVLQSQATMAAVPPITVRDPMPNYNQGYNIVNGIVEYPGNTAPPTTNYNYVYEQPRGGLTTTITPMMYLDGYEVQWNQGNMVCLKPEHWAPGVWAGCEGNTCHYQGMNRTIANIYLDERIIRFAPYEIG